MGVEKERSGFLSGIYVDFFIDIMPLPQGETKQPSKNRNKRSLYIVQSQSAGPSTKLKLHRREEYLSLEIAVAFYPDSSQVATSYIHALQIRATVGA